MRKSFDNIVQIFKVITLLTAIVILIAGSLSWAKFNKTFDDSTITFSGNSIVNDSEYQTYLAKLTSSNLYADDYSELAQRIEDHPYVAGVRVSKHFPDGILVEISERYPVALINDIPLLLIDNQYTTLPQRNNSFDFSIPIISNFNFEKEQMPLGETSTCKEAIGVVQFLNRIKIEYPELYDNLSEIRINDHHEYELILEYEPTRIVIGDSISWSKILVLKEFENNINGQKSLTDYVYLDLRYNNQVITKEREV